MKNLKQFVFLMVMFSMFVLASCEGGGDETVEADTTAPTVVSLNPDNNATGVDSAITKITVTFSEPMADGYSIGVGENKFPVDMDKDPEWKDSKTLEIYVTLTGVTDYDMVLNHHEFNNFKDVNGNSLKSYTWKFTTE